VPTPEEIRAEAEAISWFHSVDLGHGIVTDGSSEIALADEQLPPLAGRTVLDIGTWDGYYAFAAERLGARRVVALDHYAWGVDFAARDRYWEECRRAGTPPDQARDEADFFRPELPGRRGFDLARSARASAVEPVVGDFATMDLDTLGTFDVALYLGVLYHMREPLSCLERLRRITKEVAVIETAAVLVPGREEEHLVRFSGGDELNADFGNWYAPSLGALRRMCWAAGFSRTAVVAGPPSAPAARRRWARSWRAPSVSPVVPYRALVHAFP